MNLTIFGATGLVGKRLVQQALNKGYQVTAFGRNVEELIDADKRIDLLTAQKGYIFDEKAVAKALDKADAVISVIGGAYDGSDKTRSLGMKNIIEQMNKKNIQRIVALGGMGLLNAPDDSLLMDSPEYPESLISVTLEHLKALEFLKASNLLWTVFCPPSILDKDETGLYSTSVTYAPTPNKFNINAGDLAMAMLKAAIANEFAREKVGISNS